MCLLSLGWQDLVGIEYHLESCWLLLHGNPRKCFVPSLGTRRSQLTPLLFCQSVLSLKLFSSVIKYLINILFIPSKKTSYKTVLTSAPFNGDAKSR